MTRPSLPRVVPPLSPATRRVIFHGVTDKDQTVSAERTPDSPTGWCVTGWEKGLPVCRRPITAQELAALMLRYPHSQNT